MDIVMVYATGLELILPIVGAGMSLYGGIQQRNAEIAAAGAARNAAEANAAMMEQKGAEEQAVAQRRAMEQERKTKAVADRARAIGAASGAGTPLNIIAGLEATGKTAAQEEYRQGAQKRQDYENEAAVGRQKAKANYKGSTQLANAQFLGNVGQTAGNLYSSGVFNKLRG